MPAMPPPTTSAALFTGSANSCSGSSMRGPRHRHADDVLGLLGGVFLLLGVDPGAVLPDVGHVEEVLVDAGLAQRVAEQRLVRPAVCRRRPPRGSALVADRCRRSPWPCWSRRRTGSPRRGPHWAGSWRTRRRRARRRRGRCWRRSGRRRRRSWLPPAMTSRSDRVHPLGAQLPAPGVQELARQGAGPAGGHHRLRECPSAPGRRR